MTAVSIHKEKDKALRQPFRAVGGNHQSLGWTAGEALDALIAELGASHDTSLILVQQLGPDAFFSQAQYDRMRELLDKRGTLTNPEREELETLVSDELTASAKRTDAAASALGR